MTPNEPDSHDRDRWIVRGQLLFEPSEDISVRLIGDYTKRNEHCCASVYVGPVQGLVRSGNDINIVPNPLVPLLQALGANLQLPGPNQQFVRRFATSPGSTPVTNVRDWGFSGELNWDFGGAKLTSITAYRNFFTRQGIDAEYMGLDVLHRTKGDRTLKQFTEELRLQGKAFDDRLDWLVGGYYGTESIHTSDNMTFGPDFERFANCLVAGGAANPALATCGSPAPFGSLYGRFGVLPLIGSGANGSTFDVKSRNFSAFTHNVIGIIPDKLELTVGLRYTKERKKLETDFKYNNLLCPVLQGLNSALASLACVVDYRRPSIVAGSPGSQRDDDQLTGTAVLSYKTGDGLMMYASYSKGYKAGGFNLDPSGLDPLCGTTAESAAAIATCTARLAMPANTPGNGRAEAIDLQFAAEKVNTYEIGFKFHRPVFDLNVSAFYSRFKDFQLNTFNGLTFEVTNLMSCKDDLHGAERNNNPLDGACPSNRLKPGVTSKGFEIETFLRPARDFNVNLGLTYADTRYANNLVGTQGRPLPTGLFLLPGQAMSNAPKFVATGGVSWTPDIGSSGMSALFYLNGRLQSDINTGSDLMPEKIQDGYFLLNGRIGIYGADKRWGIEFWGQNLTNKQYLQVIAGAPAQGGGSRATIAAGFATSANQLFMGFPGEPRTYGVTVRTRF